jgi:hypothetical protein
MFAPPIKAPKAKSASQTVPTHAPKLPQHVAVPRWPGGSLSSIPAYAPDRLSRPEAPSPFWQPKLAIGPVNDPLEHKAGRVADQVMRNKTVAAVQGRGR